MSSIVNLSSDFFPPSSDYCLWQFGPPSLSHSSVLTTLPPRAAEFEDAAPTCETVKVIEVQDFQNVETSTIPEKRSKALEMDEQQAVRLEVLKMLDEMVQTAKWSAIRLLIFLYVADALLRRRGRQ